MMHMQRDIIQRIITRASSPPLPKKEKVKICLTRYVLNKDSRKPMFLSTPKLTSEGDSLWISGQTEIKDS